MTSYIHSHSKHYDNVYSYIIYLILYDQFNKQETLSQKVFFGSALQGCKTLTFTLNIYFLFK